jgi:hypothetical protein
MSALSLDHQQSRPLYVGRVTATPSMDLFRELFAQSGWTKAGLGRKANLSGWYVSAVLLGLEVPSPSTLARLVTILKEVVDAKHAMPMPRWSDKSPSMTIRDMAIEYWRSFEEPPARKLYPRGMVEAIVQITGRESFQVYRWLKNPDGSPLEWIDLRRISEAMGNTLECVCRVGRQDSTNEEAENVTATSTESTT